MERIMRDGRMISDHELPMGRHNVEAENAIFDRKVADHVKSKKRHLLDEWASEFLRHTRLVFLGTLGPDGDVSVSPRGGEPGFVKILSQDQIVFSDLSGNNLMESYKGILKEPKISLLCVIPGREETLRIRGFAVVQYRPPALPLTGIYVVVKIKHWYYHCGRSFRIANAWNKEVISTNEAIPFARRPLP
jgi:predicted pyridoxine 5'-phosphate oxidase superfamily flavin-nucleotide-binding protein